MAASTMQLGARTSYDPQTGIYACTLAKPHIPNLTVFQHLFDKVEFEDDRKVFTECSTGRTITFGQLKLQAQRFGVGLLDKCKLKPGDTIMSILHSSIDFIVVAMAAQFAGLKVALANPDYLATELKHVYSLTKPKKVIMNSRHLSRATKANIPTPRIIFTNYRINRAGILSVEELSADENIARGAKPHIPADLNETAYLPFSSGTTGLPKAVEITHRNVVSMLEIMVHNPGFLPEGGEQPRNLTFLPFFHAYALLCQVHLTMRVSGLLWILRPFEPVRFCNLLAELKINMLNLVPPVLTLLSKHPSANRDNFASVQRVFCGAAPLDAETQARFTDKVGVRVNQGWGMTETTVGGLGISDVQHTPGAVGCLLPATEAKLVDPETGKSLGPGPRGELWIRGGQVCKGYYNNPKASSETLTSDGFLRTGDIACVDEKTGEFSVVDRLKELIKYKGFQVAPAELEGVLVSHPSISAAAVVGVYDKDQGTELPLAFVQLKEGSALSPKEKEALKHDIDAFIRKRVSQHKYLRGGINFIPTVPVSASGKVLRKEIRKLLQAQMQDASPQAKL